MTKQFSNYSDLLTFTRASKGHALRPVSYGSELVTNGTFDTDSDWTKGTGWTISGGAAVSNNASGYGDVRQGLSLTANKIYRLEFSVTSYTSGAVKPYLGNSGNSLAEPYGRGNLTASSTADSAGDFYAFFVYDASQLSQILFRSNNGFVGSIDNVSVKEVTFDQTDGTLTLFEHPDNVPRVEYDADRNRLGLLVEEARTNNLTYSNGFTESIWTTDAGTTTANEATAPDRTNTAFSYTPDTTSARHRIRLLVGSANAGNVCASVFVKANGASHAAFQVEDKNTGRHTVVLNFSSASIVDTDNFGSPTVVDSGVSEIGNGWYRVHITLTQPATGFFAMGIGTADSDSPTYLGGFTSHTGDGSSGIYVFGAQLEAGSFPTSYIKSNSGSTTTRSADVASIPVADFGYNHKEITVMAEFIAPNWASSSTYHRVLSFDGKWGVFNDGSTASGTVRYRFDNDSNVAQFGAGNLDAATYGTSETMSKVAFALKNNDAAITKDGNAVGTDTSGDYDIELRTTLTIGAESASTNYLSGHLKTLKVYPRRLTNAQLQDLSS